MDLFFSLPHHGFSRILQNIGLVLLMENPRSVQVCSHRTTPIKNVMLILKNWYKTHSADHTTRQKIKGAACQHYGDGD